jgi:hypothetical protein
MHYHPFFFLLFEIKKKKKGEGKKNTSTIFLPEADG